MADEIKRPFDSSPADHKSGAFVLRGWDKSEQVMTFLAWKNNRREFFVQDANGNPVVVDLYLPFPTHWEFLSDPFPTSAPKVIEPFRLLPPPCRATQEEADMLLAFASSDECQGFVESSEFYVRWHHFWHSRYPHLNSAQVPEEWELRYRDAVGLRPEDDGPLEKRLQNEKNVWREEHKARLREVECITEADVQDILYGANASQRVTPEQVTAHIARERRTVVEQLYTNVTGPHGFGGCLNLTLADVKKIAGHYESYLHQKWANEHGFDLALMERTKKDFLQLMRHGFRDRLSINPDQEQSLMALVRWVIRFDGRQHVFLRAREVRVHLTAEEHAELAAIRPTLTQQPIGSPVGDDYLPLEKVLYQLSSERKGKVVPMGKHGFKKLCAREGINYEEAKKHGLRRSVLNTLLEKRQRQRRARITHLKTHNDQEAAERRW